MNPRKIALNGRDQNAEPFIYGLLRRVPDTQIEFNTRRLPHNQQQCRAVMAKQRTEDANQLVVDIFPVPVNDFVNLDESQVIKRRIVVGEYSRGAIPQILQVSF